MNQGDVNSVKALHSQVIFTTRVINQTKRAVKKFAKIPSGFNFFLIRDIQFGHFTPLWVTTKVNTLYYIGKKIGDLNHETVPPPPLKPCLKIVYNLRRV